MYFPFVQQDIKKKSFKLAKKLIYSNHSQYVWLMRRRPSDFTLRYFDKIWYNMI